MFDLEKLPSKLEVGLDKRIKKLMEHSKEWRDDLLSDPEASQVYKIIKGKGGVIGYDELTRTLMTYSVNWEHARWIIDRLISMKKIKELSGRRLAVI
jgi:hypothetical protein